MKVDPQQLLEDGYIILPQVVPPDQLDDLRASVDLLVTRHQVISASNRKPGEPPGGEWQSARQPRVEIDTVVDEITANVLEFCLGENTLGVSHQLMRGKETTPTNLQVMCSTIRDYGYTDWHRDIDAMEQTPLDGLQTDLVANAPGYVQWNIALYDDDVLWVVPGSHRRSDTEEQKRQLLADPCVPLPGSVQVKLKAGDGVVYPNIIMHWGSVYSSKLRRTIHLGYRTFGGPILPHVHFHHWDHSLAFTERLPAHLRSSFAHYADLHEREIVQIESVLRAIKDKDRNAFRAGLAELHPGDEGRIACVMLLCRLAGKIQKLKRPEVASLPYAERERLLAGPVSHEYYEKLASRFSEQEAENLHTRFARLSAILEAGADECHQRHGALAAELLPAGRPAPDFHSRPLRTFYTEMPDFEVEDFIESWGA